MGNYIAMSKDHIRLLIQPDDGAADLVKAVDRAKETVDILIFRFDLSELEKALVRAVQRGVRVHALVAHTSRGGDKLLRSLELRLLKSGVTVSRTADELVRYHGKMMIVDRKELFVLGFNYTYLDIDRSRSFGLILDDQKLIQEATDLFKADATRQLYKPRDPRFVVSPINARQSLTDFLEGAKKELLVYDLNLSDAWIVHILQERAKAGVTIRIIGGSRGLPAKTLTGLRLHTRTVVRDESSLFLGSQSLKAAELDKRREIGVILEDSKIGAAIKAVFEKDWANSGTTGAPGTPLSATKVAKRVARAVTKALPPLNGILTSVVKDMAGENASIEVIPEEFEMSVKDAIKDAVRAAVREALDEASTT